MAARVEYGWDIDITGALEVEVTDNDGTFTVAISTGTYCHTDISSIVSGYSDFATKFQADLDAGTLGALTYSVSWDGANQQYTITVSGGNIVFDFNTRGTPGTRLRQILGISSGFPPGANSHTSDMTPYYVLVSAMGAASKITFDYEPQNLVEEWETSGGGHGSVAPTSSVEYFDFSIPFESAAKTRIDQADDGTSANDIPWTFQHAQRHARGDEPFALFTDSDTTVHFMRSRAASFRPHNTRPQTDLDDLYTWQFQTFLEGRI